MNETQIQELVRKYNEGVATAEEKQALEKLLETGEVQLEDLSDAKFFHQEVMTMPFPTPSASLDNKFYLMLAKAKEGDKDSTLGKTRFMFPSVMLRVAAAVVLLITGISIGHYLLPKNSDQNQVEYLTREISDLKEMMMLSLLEKDEATERLKAVTLTQEMNSASSTVTNALVSTLNNDPNVNVRLAALEALKPYVQDSKIREELVISIAKQESPLVQVALAELMAAIQEKKSVTALEKIVKDRNTPEEVKKKIQETIKVMI
jgi:hypothetical protein